MSLFDKLKLQELSQALRDLPFSKQPADRQQLAHFCEHDGICIHFTPARTSWHALAPCALKPWWIFLQPIRKSFLNRRHSPAQLQQAQDDIDIDLDKNTETSADTSIGTNMETNAEKITTKNVDSEVTENA